MVMEKRDLILSVDVGTTGLRIGVVRADLSIITVAVQSYPTRFAQPGHAEQDPDEWWLAFRTALTELFGKMPDLPKRAAGLVISAQLCGVVPVDTEGQALRPCLIWLDKRSSKVTRAAMGGFPSILGYGAHKLLTSLWLTNGAPSLNGMEPPGKMIWLRENEPEIWGRTYKLLDVKDWFIHKATGCFVTTADSANLTWMMDTRPRRLAWSPYLMKRFGIAPHMLPDIVAGDQSPGGLTALAAADLGLPAGLPVIAGCGDVCAAALGSGQVGDGELHLSIGTSSWIGGFYPSRRLKASEGYATILSPINNRPLLIATQESAGSCLDWYDSLASGAAQTRLFRADPNAAPPPLFLPWLAGERVPADDERLRGGFLGLSLMHDSRSLAQGVIEGVALNTRWAYRSVRQQKGTAAGRRLRVVGGVTQNHAFCQTLANCLATELSIAPEARLSGVQGAAAIAGAHLGFFPNPWEAARSLGEKEEALYRPDPRAASYFDRRFDLFVDAYRRNAPWFRTFYNSEGERG